MGNRQSSQEEREQSTFSNILSLECIPEEQKLKVEGEVDWNFSVEKVSGKSEHNDPANETKAILLSPVIKCIFKYLDLHDIKNCRYVCPEWNSVAQPILRSRSKICFPKKTSDGTKLLLSQFYETFAETLESMPFTAFQMNDYDGYTFNHYELDNFFRQQKNTLRELRVGVRYASFNYMWLEMIDVTPWIMESPIAEETKYYTKFAVCGSFSYTRIMVQNCVLANVKELDLFNCQINLEDKDEIKCRPIVLKLKCVAFFKNGVKLQEICVNDYFDFSRLKHLELLSFQHHADRVTKLSLDMKGKMKLERLSLEKVTRVNWRTCRWEVNKLELLGLDFVEETEMEIQDLHLWSQNYWPNKIDICRLPQSIKKLTIKKFTLQNCFCSQPVIFHNLQYLSLNLYDSFSTISDFVQCPNLVNLHLESRQPGVEMSSDSDWIPNTVKKLKLEHVSINWTENKNNLKLDKLVMIDNPLFNVKKICSGLNQIKELIVRFPESEPANENMFNFFLVRNSCDLWKTIVVGRFHWSNISFGQNPLINLVGRKAEYYTIENQIIKGFDDSLTFGKYENIQD